MLSGAGVIRLAQGGKPIILASEETVSRWAATYAKNSPNWASGSPKETLSALVPNAKAVLSPAGEKTVFANAKYEVKVDNLFNYFRVRNLSTNQYVDAAGGMVKTGRLSGKEAKNFLQQQTHIRNLDP